MYLSSDTILDVNNDTCLNNAYILKRDRYPELINDRINLLFDTVSLKNHLLGEYYLFTVLSNDSSIPLPNNIVKNKVKLDSVFYDASIKYVKGEIKSSYSGGYIEISSTIVNKSSAFLDYSTSIKFYFSSDSILDDSDYTISNYNIGGFDPGMNYELNALESINQYPLNNVKYLIAFVDPYDNIKEINEENNLCYFKLETETDTTDDDLILTSVKISDTLYLNTEQEFTFSLYNGFYVNKNSNLSMYLSKDSVLDKYDYQLLNETTSILEGNSLYQYQLPYQWQVDTGDYYLITYLDSKNHNPEKNEENNIICKKVKVLPELADFHLCNLNLLNVILNNGSYLKGMIEVGGDYISNYQSTAKLSIYISNDRNYDNSDRLIFSKKDNVAYLSSFFECQLPDTLTQNTYFLYFVIDSCEGFVDPVLRNNNLYQQIYIQNKETDVSINDISLSYSGQYTYTLTNKGFTDLAFIKTSFYLSRDTVLDLANDHFFGYDILHSLNYGTTIKSTIYNMPTSCDIDTGNYYIIIITDRDSVLPDVDFTNNIKFIEYKKEPEDVDLKICGFSLYSNNIFYPGIGIGFNTQIQNLKSYYGDYNIRFNYYFSTDTILDENDIFSGTEYDNIDAGFGIYNFRGQLTIPKELPYGNYYLLIEFDPLNEICETNEDNNLYYFSFSIEDAEIPDLKLFSTPEIPSEITEGETLEVNFQITNDGERISNQFLVKAFISKDQNIDLLKDVTIYEEEGAYNGIAGKSTYNYYIYKTVPDIETGNYYFILEIDFLDNVKESNEENNIFIHPVYVKKSDHYNDLIVNYVEVDSMPVYQGNNISVECQILNSGSETMGTNYLYPKIEIFLSDNGILDDSDKKLWESFVSIMENTGYSWEKYQLNISDSIEPGEYFLLVKIDTENEIEESNKLNNMFVFPFEIFSKNDSLIIKNKFNQKENTEIKFYPNPVKDKLYIESPEKINSYTIYDINGKSIIHNNHPDFLNIHNVQNLNHGVYFIRINKNFGTEYKMFHFIKIE